MRADRLVDLVGRKARVLAIMNALDGLPRAKREALEVRSATDFAEIGLQIRELDLRRYFNSPSALVDDLREADLVWASGGNAFTLMMAMTQSGFREVIADLLSRDAVAYGGYSAGAVVAGPTLRGIDLVDSADPVDAAPPGYGKRIQWDGLGLVDYAIAPHFRSGHWESEAIDAVVRYFVEHDIPHRVLRDGEVILVSGDSETVLPLLGLGRHEVRVCPSAPTWRIQFLEWRSRIHRSTGVPVDRIEHVGSTSVPDLAAKPILDIDVGITDSEDIEDVAVSLVRSGFIDRGHERGGPGRLLVYESTPEVRTVHLHVMPYRSKSWRRDLAFREALRSDAALRDRYAGMKRELAERFSRDRRSYRESKKEFITNALDRSMGE